MGRDIKADGTTKMPCPSRLLTRSNWPGDLGGIERAQIGDIVDRKLRSYYWRAEAG